MFHLNFNNVVEEPKLHPCVYVFGGASRLGTPEILLALRETFPPLRNLSKEILSKDNSIFQPSIFRCYKYFSFRESFFLILPRVPSISRVESSFPPRSRKYGGHRELHLMEITQVLRFDRGRIYLDLRSRFIYVWTYWWNDIYIYICVCSQIWGYKGEPFHNWPTCIVCELLERLPF